MTVEAKSHVDEFITVAEMVNMLLLSYSHSIHIQKLMAFFLSIFDIQ